MKRNYKKIILFTIVHFCLEFLLGMGYLGSILFFYIFIGVFMLPIVIIGIYSLIYISWKNIIKKHINKITSYIILVISLTRITYLCFKYDKETWAGDSAILFVLESYKELILMIFQ